MKSLEERAYEPERYEFAAVALNMLEREDEARYVPGAIENLFYSLGGDSIYHDTIRSTEGAVENLLKIAGKKYDEELGGMTVQELYDNYLQEYADESLDDDGKKAFEKEIGAFADRKYSDITGRVKELGWILSDKWGNIDNEEKESAKSELKKYERVIEYIERMKYLRIANKKLNAVKKANELFFKKGAEED